MKLDIVQLSRSCLQWQIWEEQSRSQHDVCSFLDIGTIRAVFQILASTEQCSRSQHRRINCSVVRMRQLIPVLLFTYVLRVRQSSLCCVVCAPRQAMKTHISCLSWIRPQSEAEGHQETWSNRKIPTEDTWKKDERHTYRRYIKNRSTSVKKIRKEEKYLQ